MSKPILDSASIPFVPNDNMNYRMACLLYTSKTVLPQNLTADTNLVHARINHYYTVAMGRADVDLDCLYSAFIRVCSLYSAGMRQIYTEAVNEKPLERGRGHMCSFSFENKTYMACLLYTSRCV